MLFVGRAISGVIEEDRTLDLQSHNLAFCQLNYDHHKKVVGAPGRIRTFDLCLRRALLYPAELPGRLVHLTNNSIIQNCIIFVNIYF